MAHLLGIRSPLEPVCSITLGVEAVNPLEMTNAYATLAARGVRHYADPLVQLTNRNGREIDDVSSRPKQVLATNDADLVTYRAAGRDHRRHRAPPPTSADRPQARREPPRNTWTPGSAATRRSSPRACGWATRMARSRMTSVEGVSPVFGGTIPAAIWQDFMTVAMEGQPVESFATPSYEGHTIGPETPVSSPTPSPSRRHRSESPSPEPSPTGSPVSRANTYRFALARADADRYRLRPRRAQPPTADPGQVASFTLELDALPAWCLAARWPRSSSRGRAATEPRMSRSRALPARAWRRVPHGPSAGTPGLARSRTRYRRRRSPRVAAPDPPRRLRSRCSACACLAALESASCTTRYASVSRSSGISDPSTPENFASAPLGRARSGRASRAARGSAPAPPGAAGASPT